MIQPKPFVVKCPNCNQEAILHPKSDSLSPSDMIKLCQKCNILMERTNEPSISSKIKLFFKI